MTNITNHTLDLILQGPLYSYTVDIANQYSLLPFINRVIVSCWESDPDPNTELKENVFVLKNKDVPYPGIGNRNRQIKSVLKGLDHIATEYSIKMRTDQLVSLESMHKLYHFYFNNCGISDSYKGAYNKVGIHGMCTDFPFHPIDHIYWGNTQDLLNLFDIEYDTTEVPKQISDSEFNHYIRSEIYLTLPYVSRFDPEVRRMIANHKEYFYDNSPKKEEAMALSKIHMEEIFLVFPKIQMQWIKYGMQQYHYDLMETAAGGHAIWSKD